MVKLKKVAQCGTLESCDILVTVEPLPEGSGREIILNSPVKKQFGKYMEKVIVDILDKYEIKDIKVNAQDNGALDATISARMEVAVRRGLEL